MLQYQDITVAVGKTQAVGIPGRFVYYLTGSAGGADPTIAIRSGNTASVSLLKPGQSFRLADSDKTVDTFYIANFAGQAPIVGQLLVGDGDFTDNRVSGSVEVIDGGRSRTLANQAFDSSTYSAGVAGQYAGLQLWNPAGSGKRIVVKRVTAASATAGAIGIKLTQTMLATKDANCASKLASGASSTAELRYQNLAAVPAERGMTSLSVASGVSMDRVYQEPVVLQPGWGLFMWTNALGADTNGGFEFYEESL